MAAFVGYSVDVSADAVSVQASSAYSADVSLDAVGRQNNSSYDALAAGSASATTYYSLACFDNAGVRHYWTDTSVSMTNAPGGFTYVTSTLTVQG